MLSAVLAGTLVPLGIGLAANYFVVEPLQKKKKVEYDTIQTWFIMLVPNLPSFPCAFVALKAAREASQKEQEGHGGGEKKCGDGGEVDEGVCRAQTRAGGGKKRPHYCRSALWSP